MAMTGREFIELLHREEDLDKEVRFSYFPPRSAECVLVPEGISEASDDTFVGIDLKEY